MGKTKAEKKAEKKKAKKLAEAKDDLFQSNGLSPPPLRPLGEDSALRPPKEDLALRSSSEEGVLDTSLSAHGKEQAPESTVSSSAKVEEDNGIMSVAVMTKDKETTAVLTGGGNAQHPLPVQLLMSQAMRFLRPDKPAEQKAMDNAEPARAEKAEEANVEVDYEGDSQDDETESALRNGQQPLEDSALRNGQQPLEDSALRNGQPPFEAPALRIEPTMALVPVPPSHLEEKDDEGVDVDAEGTSDSALSIASDLMMEGNLRCNTPEEDAAKSPLVLNAKDIMEIATKKNISIKTRVNDHNPQRQGLEDNLFEFGDALLGYTSDGGTIRINQGLATFMLIAATAEMPNRLLMEKKREAFEEVTAQAQDLLTKQRQDYERQREAIELQHQEHLELMRKQNELLQEEVKKTRELYSQTYQQFEISPPPVKNEDQRALVMQSVMARNFQLRAERYKADYEAEARKREQKEKDLEEAEARIKRLHDELAFLEGALGSLDVVTKRPLTPRGDLDSPELNPGKKAKIEEVPANLQAINAGQSKDGIKSVDTTKKDISIKNKDSIKNNGSIKKKDGIRDSSIPSSATDKDDVLELNHEGDIVSKAAGAVKGPPPTIGHKNYVPINSREADKSNLYGFQNRAKPAPLKSLLGEQGLKGSDDDLREQSLIAWRHHLRSQGRYRPDKALPIETSEAHVKILMAALSNFKKERVNCSLSKKAAISFKHPRYSTLYKSYDVPEMTCTPYELMSKVDKDRDILFRLRCAPLNEFYSMLMEDTPGYVPSGHWNRPPIRDSLSAPLRKDDARRSTSSSSKSPEYSAKSPIKNSDEAPHVSIQEGLQRQASSRSRETRSSKSPEHPIKKSFKSWDGSTFQQASSSSAEPSNTKLDVLWGSTEHLSDRRFKNSQRGPRVNPIAGEEPGYASESGNEHEDRDNSFYDPRIVPSDKALLADWLYKIKRIKRHNPPQEYLDVRDQWLKNAEQERIKFGTIPTALHDVEPPYDKGRGLALMRFDEMRIADFEKRISDLRERNAASCAKYDAAKKHGPRDGQARR